MEVVTPASASLTGHLDDNPWISTQQQFLARLSDSEKALFHNATPKNLHFSPVDTSREDITISKNGSVIKELAALVHAIDHFDHINSRIKPNVPFNRGTILGCIRVVIVAIKCHRSLCEEFTVTLARIGGILTQFHYKATLELFRTYAALQEESDAYLNIVIFCCHFLESIHNHGKQGVDNTLYLKSLCDEAIRGSLRYKERAEKAAISSSQLEMAEVSHTVVTSEITQRRGQILSALCELDCSRLLETLRANRSQNSGSTLFEIEEYVSWRSLGGFHVLFCYGCAGSGKSTLASSIIDELCSDSVVVFCLCEYSKRATLQPAHIFSYLARQLLKSMSSVPEVLEALIVQAKRDEEGFLDLATSIDVLEQCIKVQLVPVYMVLDGLEEISSMLQHQVIQGLKQILNNQPLSVKLCLTGNEDLLSEVWAGPIVAQCRIPISLCTNNQDFDRFVRMSVEELIQSGDLVTRDPSLREYLTTKLIEVAEPNYILLQLQLQDICDTVSDREIEIVLEDLPRTITDVYDRRLSRIVDSRWRTIIDKMLKWLVCARRSLHVDELCEAVSFALEDEQFNGEKVLNGFDRLQQECRHLVDIEKGTQTVQLAHYTLQDYLLEPRSNGFHFNLKQANAVAGELCIAYLNFYDFGTQITPRRINRDLATLERITSSQDLVQSMVAQRLIRVWKAVRRPQPVHLPKDMAQYIPRRQISLAGLEKYRLLPYVSSHWLWHTKDLDSTPSQGPVHNALRDQLFGNLISKDLPFDFRPWDKVEKNARNSQLLEWAVMTNHAYLLRIAMSASGQTNPELFREALLSMKFSSSVGGVDVTAQSILQDGMSVFSDEFMSRSVLHQEG